MHPLKAVEKLRESRMTAERARKLERLATASGFDLAKPVFVHLHGASRRLATKELYARPSSFSMRGLDGLQDVDVCLTPHVVARGRAKNVVRLTNGAPPKAPRAASANRALRSRGAHRHRFIRGVALVLSAFGSVLTLMDLGHVSAYAMPWASCGHK